MKIASPICFLLFTLILACLNGYSDPVSFSPRVEIEEDVYDFTPADNGAGPMWCHGSTCLVRIGEEVYASGIETVSGARPLNNCLPTLFHRTDTADGWEMIYKGEGRTREPSPLAAFHDGRFFLSLNPTLTPPDTYSGPARPQILEGTAGRRSEAFQVHRPVWQGEPPFSEHSYRSFAADGNRGELILFQNIEYDRAEWSFRDREGKWSAQGQLVWPWGAEYEKPQPIRVCYPAVALKDRAVHFLGVSDIQEPDSAWREYKKQLTGRDWDYDFRRLFYTRSDDIRGGVFHEWVEVSSREKTCGWIFPMDLYPAQNGDVYVMWSERALDERLREKFFPDEKQKYTLNVATVRDGQVIKRTECVRGDEQGGQRPGDARFHVTPDGRLFIVCYIDETDANGKNHAANWLYELDKNGDPVTGIELKLQKPLSSFFTATPRAGCKPSDYLDLFGAAGNTMRYVRIRIF